MAKNLTYLPSVVPSATGSQTTPYYYVYDYEGTDVSAAKATTNYTTHGVLYNWTAASTACPSGWHLPSDAEYKTLEMYLGMSQAQADIEGWRGTNEGSKLSILTLNGNNSSGFNAQMSGNRLNLGFFNGINAFTHFWTSPQYDSDNAWWRYVKTGNSKVARHYGEKDYGFSVRCLRD